MRDMSPKNLLSSDAGNSAVLEQTESPQESFNMELIFMTLNASLLDSFMFFQFVSFEKPQRKRRHLLLRLKDFFIPIIEVAFLFPLAFCHE